MVGIQGWKGTSRNGVVNEMNESIYYDYKVNVDFWLSADDFDLHETTKIIGMNPTDSWLKANGKIQEYAKTCWMYSTDYQYSYAVEFQLAQIKNVIESKIFEIREYCKKNNIDMGFTIGVRAKSFILPELIIPMSFIKFAAQLNASCIAFDIYDNLGDQF